MKFFLIALNSSFQGDLYGLFACMVTGRPWETVMQGLTKVKYSKEEVCLILSELSPISDNIILYFAEKHTAKQYLAGAATHIRCTGASGPPDAAHP